MDRLPNFIIFDEGSGYWDVLTEGGQSVMPKYVTSVIIGNGVTLEERKHPITLVEEGQWMINYSNSI